MTTIFRPFDTASGRYGFCLDIRRAIGALLLCVLVGCGAPQTTNMETAVDVVSADTQAQLREDLNRFSGFWHSTVDQASMQIERQAASEEIRRRAILWPLRMGAQYRSAADERDSREALLDVWSFCERMLDYFQTGAGQSMFGPGQTVAVTAATRVLEEIERIARQHISADQFDQVRQGVIAYADQHPMQGEFSERPAQELGDAPAGQKLLAGIAGVPLAPIRALTGVGRTPESIHEVSASVDRFTDVFEGFPYNARRQLQLLLMSVEESQSEVRATLVEARQTIEQIQVATQDVANLNTAAGETVVEVREASAALESAAEAVAVTAKEIMKFVPATMKDETGQIVGRQPSPVAAGGPPPERPEAPNSTEPQSFDERSTFSFQAVTASAEALGETTEKLQGLLAELRELLASGSISDEMDGVNTQLGQTLDLTSGRVEYLIDHAAWRAAQLVALLFVLLLVYRLLTVRAVRAKAALPPKP
jgi:hypothetical protein